MALKWHPAPASPISAKYSSKPSNYHTTQRAHHADVEVTPPVASTPAYHVQSHHHCSQMSKQLCPSIPVQWNTVCWSAPDWHALCLCGPSGSSNVANWIGDRSFSIARPWVWNTLPISLQDINSSWRFRKTPEIISLCLTATAPLALNWYTESQNIQQSTDRERKTERGTDRETHWQTHW